MWEHGDLRNSFRPAAKSALPRLRSPPTLTAVKQPKPSPTRTRVPEHCAAPEICPLNRVAAGTVVCVRELAASADVRSRLREMGLGEDQHVKLLSRQHSVICQVCNVRVALSAELAAAILVEPVTA